MAIKIMDKEIKPTAICPHCRKKQYIDIRPFEKDITRPIQAKCVHCGGTIFAALLILLQTDLESLYKKIAAIVETVNPKNRNLV